MSRLSSPPWALLNSDIGLRDIQQVWIGFGRCLILLLLGFFQHRRLGFFSQYIGIDSFQPRELLEFLETQKSPVRPNEPRPETLLKLLVKFRSF